MNLEQSNISYVIISSDKLNDMTSILYAKEYNIIPIKGYYKDRFEESIITYGPDNDSIRKDTLFILNHFDHDSAIIKYVGESSARRIFKDGSERVLGIIMYNTDSENVSYIYEGVSFSFVEKSRYWSPNKKEDFKVGMIVEYMNNNRWLEKRVENPDSEYEKLYKLLIKHNRVRVPVV